MKKREPLLRVYRKPQLKEPLLIAAGPGTANVGLRAVSYLREKLGAELLAEIKPGEFFIPPYTLAFREGIIELEPMELGEQAPQNKFHYWKADKVNDLLFFEGDTHPMPGRALELASYVLDTACRFGIRRVFIPGAFLTDVHHLSAPRLYGIATDNKLLEYLHSYNIEATPPINIAHNLNAWLLGMAKQKDIDAVGLVGEIPFYNAEGQNIRACRALVKALCQMLGLKELDFADLDLLLDEEETQIERKLDDLRKSVDEKASEFLHYLELLQERREWEPDQNRSFHMQEELPESLKHLEELYAQARQDTSRVQQLKAELDRLKDFDRLLMLRKYGEELLKLLGEQR